MSVYYYDKDVNMMNYLGSKIECYVLNDYIKNNMKDTLTIQSLITMLDPSNGPHNFVSLPNFYIDKDENGANIRYYEYNDKDDKDFIETKEVYKNLYYSISLDTLDKIFRISILNRYNLTYDYSYLISSTNEFMPKTLSKNSTEIPLLSLLSYIAPKIYLEICASYVNDFFVTLFQDYKNNRYIKSGQTVNTINSWCKDSKYVSNACAVDKSNPRCACQNCYNKHSYQNRMIAKQLLDSDSSNTDPWCYYPDCAKGSAIKNQLGVNRSVCSNLSVSGIFVNPSEYSNVNISNTQVSASAYNNKGINIFSNEGCNSCTKNQKCIISNKLLKCVDNSTGSQENKLDEKSSSSTSRNVYLILVIIIGVFIVITAVVSFILYKNPTVKFISTPVIAILSILCAIMVYFYQRTNESFIFPDYFTTTSDCDIVSCYSDTDCQGSAIEGKVCLFNDCSIPIGKFLNKKSIISDFPDDNSGKLITDCIINNLLYAPQYYYTGRYFCSMFINNVLYAFAENCTLSFDGTKWVEKAIRSDQSGFNPYTPVLPSTTTLYKTNFYYNNNVYLPIYQQDQQEQLTFNVYNTLDDSWNTLSLDIPNNKDTFMGIYQEKIYIYNTTGEMYVYDIDTNQIKKYNVSNSASAIFITLFNINNVLYFITNEFHLYIWNVGDPSFVEYYIEGTMTNVNILNIDVDTGSINFLYYDNDGWHYFTFDIANKQLSDTGIIINADKVPLPTSKNLVCQNNNSDIKYNFIMTESGEIFRIYADKSDKVSLPNVYINPCYGITNFDVPRNFPIN